MTADRHSNQAGRLSATVVICAYTEERWDDIVLAVESACHQDYPARDVVVVVDHNADLLARCKRRFPDQAGSTLPPTPSTSGSP